METIAVISGVRITPRALPCLMIVAAVLVIIVIVFAGPLIQGITNSIEDILPFEATGAEAAITEQLRSDPYANVGWVSVIYSQKITEEGSRTLASKDGWCVVVDFYRNNSNNKERAYGVVVREGNGWDFQYESEYAMSNLYGCTNMPGAL